MFIEPMITWVPSGFSGYIWLDTKIVLKKKKRLREVEIGPNGKLKFVGKFLLLDRHTWSREEICRGSI